MANSRNAMYVFVKIYLTIFGQSFFIDYDTIFKNSTGDDKTWVFVVFGYMTWHQNSATFRRVETKCVRDQ